MHMAPLSGWENFYVIVGSSAGALVGLQFVVLTLVAERIRGGLQATALRVFTTPTIVHFAAILLLAGAAVAPLPGILPLAILWCAMGGIGVLYCLGIARCLGRITAYRPQMADWIYYFAWPLAAYMGVAAGGGFLLAGVRESAYGVAVGVLLLLLTGIHNAWDIVTYHVLQGQTADKPLPVPDELD